MGNTHTKCGMVSGAKRSSLLGTVEQQFIFLQAEKRLENEMFT